VLFSTAGAYASLGTEGYRGALAAIAEVNAFGAYPFDLVAVARDPNGSIEAYAGLCRDLIDSSGANFVVGCTTSWSRKEVIPVLERSGTHLWYPCPYEGFEANDHVVYVGSCPNQHVVPLLDYVLERFGHDPILVGSNYIWGWETNRIAREGVERRGGVVKGERYLPLGDIDVAHIIEEIRLKRPDFILNTLIGPSSLALVEAYWSLAQDDAVFAAERRPIISCNWTESEIAVLGAKAAGHLTVAPYFQSMPTVDNASFLATAKRFAPEQRFISAFFAQAYAAVHMIARGIAATGTTDAGAVLGEAKSTAFAAPFGPLRIHAETNHAILTPQIGRAGADGSFGIVSRAEAPILPDPYLAHADRGEAAARSGVPYLRVVK
jgi:branched-chain amino acid transport system substrate-binding protein